VIVKQLYLPYLAKFKKSVTDKQHLLTTTAAFYIQSSAIFTDY